jgi:predicted nucleic acid-binding protein
MVAVDATVLADLLIGEDSLRAAASTLALEDPDWICTSLWRYELGNVLWKEVGFRKGDRARLKVALDRAEPLLLETIEVVDAVAVWEIACDTGLTYYDASYVWLARFRGLKLRTRDGQILKACPDVALDMPEVPT